MSDDNDIPEGPGGARRDDPETSRDAGDELSTRRTHCAALARVYQAAWPDALTDAKAAAETRLPVPDLWKRSADLRKAGLIEWVRYPVEGAPMVKVMGPRGRYVGVCVWVKP